LFIIRLNLGVLRFYLICNETIDAVLMMYWKFTFLTETRLALTNKRDKVVLDFNHTYRILTFTFTAVWFTDSNRSKR